MSLCHSLPITDSEDDGESEAAKQLIQPIAEKIIAKYKAKEEEAPLLFFVAGEVSASILERELGAPGSGVRVLLESRQTNVAWKGGSSGMENHFLPLLLSSPSLSHSAASEQQDILPGQTSHVHLSHPGSGESGSHKDRDNTYSLRE